MEMLRIIPAEFLAYGENVLVSMTVRVPSCTFFIDVIAITNIGRLCELHLAA